MVSAPCRSAALRDFCGALAWLVLSLPVAAPAAHPPDAPVADTEAHVLPFRPLQGPDDVFTASMLTMSSDRAWIVFSKSRGPRIDLQELDRHGYFPPGDVPADSTARALYERTLHPEVAEVTPAEKDAATPPQPGAHVGIPSAAAATGALIGGLAILLKILTLGI